MRTQDEVVWKINEDKFKIALKVKCYKNISESCCSEALLQPSQQVVLTLVTALSKCYQQSPFILTGIRFQTHLLVTPSQLFKGLVKGRDISFLCISLILIF